MTAPTTYANPYWDTVAEFAHHEEYHSWDKGLFIGGYDRDTDRALHLRRNDLVSEYAWTITAPATVEFVAEQCGPRVVDPLAGSGYWAFLLGQLGADVAASDLEPGASRWHRHGLHVPVAQADAVDAVKAAADRVLLLAWPPYAAPIGAQVIEAYAGDRIVYIGEGDYGCCGDDDMWTLLGSAWHEVAEHRPVQWWGLHDWVTVYERGPRPDGGEPCEAGPGCIPCGGEGGNVAAGPYGVADWRAPLTDFERRAGVLNGEEMQPPPCADHQASELSCPVCTAQRRAFYAALGRGGAS